MKKKFRKVLSIYIDDLHYRVSTYRIKTHAYTKYIVESNYYANRIDLNIKKLKQRDTALEMSRNIHDIFTLIIAQEYEQ